MRLGEVFVKCAEKDVVSRFWVFCGRRKLRLGEPKKQPPKSKTGPEGRRSGCILAWCRVPNGNPGLDTEKPDRGAYEIVRPGEGAVTRDAKFLRDYSLYRGHFNTYGMGPPRSCQSVGTSSSPGYTSVTAKAPQRPLAFHPTITGSCLASGGKARRVYSRRCSKMRAIASRRFARHSSCVFPCPFAPGASAQ